jgi:hypothetical protein
LSTTSPFGGSNPAKTPGSTTWSDSSAWQRPNTHTANITKAAIQELDWEILSHQPYSPNLAPSDYRLFRSLSNNLCGVSLNNDAELENWVDDFFTAKPADFFKRGIENMPERWEAVVDNGGAYIID